MYLYIHIPGNTLPSEKSMPDGALSDSKHCQYYINARCRNTIADARCARPVVAAGIVNPAAPLPKRPLGAVLI